MEEKRLDGWKAIASYLNRSVRQCHRLAETKGLPIHRFPGTRAVFAWENELDRWLLDASSQVLPEYEAQAGRSEDHVTIPAKAIGAVSPPAKVREASPAAHLASQSSGRFSRVVPVGVLTLLVVALLVFGVHHRHQTAWRNMGKPLTGAWTFRGSGVVGRSQSVARFDTGHLVAPGTTATVTLRTSGTRWSGGLEIFEDDLHWTYVSVSPREHEIVVERFPTGSVETFFMGESIEPAHPITLRMNVGASSLRVSCDRSEAATLVMAPWDVDRGLLLLRVGSAGDELHEPSGGTCSFEKLHIQGAPSQIPSDVVHKVADDQRPSSRCVLTVDNIDDQVDVLIDGKRLASAGYREEIGPLDIDPYLTRGRHTITALLFNRKWTASYGIQLSENGTTIWQKSCGSVTKAPYGCLQIGDRLGMVKRLSFTFTAR